MRRSGAHTIPLLIRISSAAKVVGPFAPSMTALHLSCGAFDLLIDFSIAAGTKKSHYFSIKLSGLIISVSSARGYPSNVPFSVKYFLTSSGSNPLDE